MRTMPKPPTRPRAATTPALLAPVLLALALAALAMAIPALAADSDYPLRTIYPEVPYITTEELMERYDEAVIVDIRSEFEYEVAHVNKAALLPMDDEDFAPRLAELRAPEGEAPLVFYCNGHTCAKSYKASQLALSLGFQNVYTYDSGIFEWIKAAPDRSTLMGRTPADDSSIIPHGMFVERLLPFERFRDQGMAKDAVFVDIRDPFQRELVPDLPGVKNIPLDPLLEMVTAHVWTEKTLFFFDAVGKQVRWLQYYLESHGYYDYAFLYGGVREIADDPELVHSSREDRGTVRVFQEMLSRAASDQTLTGRDVKLLAQLMGQLKFNNYAAMDQNELAQAMGLAPEGLKASLDRLARGGYLTHRTLRGTLIFHVNPRLAWKGATDSDLWESEAQAFGEEP